MTNIYFARFARAFEFCMPLWLFHGRREHVTTNFHFAFWVSPNSWYQFHSKTVRTQFAGQSSWNILEIFAETQSSTFWLHSRSRWFCLCLMFLFTLRFYHTKPHQTTEVILVQRTDEMDSRKYQKQTRWNSNYNWEWFSFSFFLSVGEWRQMPPLPARMAIWPAKMDFLNQRTTVL